MSLTIDELSQSSCDRRRTSPDTTPAPPDHTDLGPVCATLFGARLAACAGVAPGGGADARLPPGDRGLAGDGACPGTPVYQRPSGLEPRHLVSAPRQPDAVRRAHHAAGAAGSDDRA